jgi:hypothetical protein
MGRVQADKDESGDNRGVAGRMRITAAKTHTVDDDRLLLNSGQVQASLTYCNNCNLTWRGHAASRRPNLKLTEIATEKNYSVTGSRTPASSALFVESEVC